MQLANDSAGEVMPALDPRRMTIESASILAGALDRAELPELVRNGLLTAHLTPDEAYAAGFDCGKRGPTRENCDFRLFRTRELTDEWERGKRDAEQGPSQRVKPQRSTALRR